MICSVLAGALICDELVVHFLGDLPSHGILGVLADRHKLEHHGRNENDSKSNWLFESGFPVLLGFMRVFRLRE